jgi:DNA-directed RNA polymerase specialized sigma24 family protein
LAFSNASAGSLADKAWLTQRFEENRSYLRAVGYRMLESYDQAEDAVNRLAPRPGMD